jgi:phage-related protein|tara:strand:+ start:4603 stop:6174 length:1572 start_codon:yes stop_codon:yes gene_type:complete
MTARNYDVILTVSNAASFTTSNFIVGNTTATTAVIANVDSVSNTLKVKLNNSLQQFSSTEVIHSNSITISGTTSGKLSQANTFTPNVMSGNVTTAIANISAITPGTFIAEKNSFSQNPIVRLYSIYYPGEWYPPNQNGNPTGQGEGRAWPLDFPIRFAEVTGDYSSDLYYNVIHDGINYMPFPVNLSGFDVNSDGKINELSLTVFNVDNIISAIVEDPFLVGNNLSNSVIAVVNNEPVHGIDPRTVNATPADVGSQGDDAFDTLTRARANGLAYSTDIVNTYGRANATFTKTQTEIVKGRWQAQKQDTRDLLGAVVEIKTTFANFIDYWPEYSTVRFITSNVVEVFNAVPYRVGDNVITTSSNVEGTIQAIEENRLLFLSNPLGDEVSVGAPIYIVNNKADPESYIEDKFKINQLESLNDYVANFGLVSWLQYFKVVTPKRKYYKNTCQWRYKGEECQYPGPGGLAIPGTSLTSNANPIAANNEIASDAFGDVCAKSLSACTLRNNQIHFGGFPATGRTVPRQ